MSWRRAARLTGLCVLGLGALGVVGVLFLTTAPGNELIRRVGVDAFNRTFPDAELEVEGLRTRLVDGVTLRGVHLVDHAGQALVSSDRIWLGWDLRGALRGRLVVSELRLDEPQVDLRPGDRGGLALLEALGLTPSPEPTAPSQPWGGLQGEVVVRSVVIRDGGLTWAGGGVEQLNLDLAGHVEGATVEVRGIRGTARLHGPVEGDVALTGGASLQAGDLSVDALRVRLMGSTVELSGVVEQVETTPVIDLSVRAPGVLAEDLRALLGDGAPAVDLAVDGRLEGGLDDLRSLITVDAASGGRLSAGLQADLLADRPAWSVDLLAEPLDLRALYPAQLTQPVSIGELQLALRGSGLDWPGGLAAYVELSADGAVLFGEELPSLALDGSVAGGQLQLHQVLLTHAAGLLRAEGGLSFSDQSLALDADVDLPQLAALSGLARTDLGGRGRWRPAVEVAWGDALTVDVSGPLEVEELTVAGLVLPRGRGPLRVEYGPEGLDLSGLLSASGLSTRGVVLDETQVSWRVVSRGAAGTEVVAELQAVDITADGVAATVQSAEGTVTVQLPAEGDLSVRADLEVVGLEPSGRPGSVSARGPVQLQLQGDALEVALDLEREDGSDVVSGVLRGELGDGGGWTLSDLVVEPLPGLRWVGLGDQHLRMGSEGIAALQVHLEGSAGNVAVELDADSGELSLVGDRLDLAQLMRLEDLVPRAAGEGSDQAGGPLDLRGVAALDLRLSRTAGAPDAIAGHLSVAGLSAAGKVQGVDARLGLDGPLTRPVVALDVSRAGEGGRLLTARGHVPIDIEARELGCGQSLDLRVILPPVLLSEARARVPVLPEGEARLSADLAATGDSCDPDLRLVAAADGPAGQDGEVVRVDLVLERISEELSLAAYVEQDFRRRLLLTGTARTGLGETLLALRTGGSVVFDDPSRWADQLMLSVVPLDLSLEDLATFVELPAGLEGRIAGGFQVTGSPTSPAIGGAAQMIEGRIGGVDVSSGLLILAPADGGYDVSLDLGLEDPTVAGVDGEERPEPSPFQVTGFIPVDLVRTADSSILASEGLDLVVTGSLPLALMEGVVTGVSDTSGAVDLSGRVTGSLVSPKVEAEAGVTGASLTYAPLGLVYEDIELGLRLTGERLFLDELSISNRKRFALLGMGNRAGRRTRQLTASGEASLAGFTPTEVDATVDLDGFWLIADRDHELALSGQLALAGLWPAPRLEGALVLDSSQLYFGEEVFVGDRSFEVDPSITIHRTSTPTVGRTDDEPEPAAWRHFDIDVDVDLLRNLRLRATVPMQSDYGQQFAQLSSVGLDADLGGEVRVIQVDSVLVLQGEIETLRGTATVLGVPFDVRGGTISFLGDGYANPLIDIRAVRHTGSYGDVNVHVGGFVDNLAIEPSSEEYPDKTDVVTLLLFGKPASEMADGEGQASNQVIAAALSAMTGSLEQAIGASVVDELEIDPAGAVRVGWALSDRLFLRLEQRFVDDDTSNRTEVTLEYLISRRLYAEFTTGDRAASAANLYWRWRF